VTLGQESNRQPLAWDEPHYDRLTELPNRKLFEDRVEQSVAQARRSGERIALHYLELDELNNLTQTHGPLVRDDLIRRAADRVRRLIRKSDTFARLQGGEFGIIQRNVENPLGFTTLSQRILHLLDEPFSVEGQHLKTGASIGISLMTADAEAKQLMLQTEQALRDAKKGSRQHFRFHDADLDEAVRAKLVVQAELHQAIERQEFFLEYQPQLNLAGNRIMATEALLRWLHPDRGVILPGEFITVAEDIGLILPLGRWVLKEACRQRQAWFEAGLKTSPIAVNVSGVQLRDPGFPDMVLNTLSATGLDPELLDLELTESVLLQYSDEIRNSLSRLHLNRVKISIDDFGTGYSSLRYLTSFPAHKLKIARELVHDITSNRDAASIVNAVIRLGHELNMEVVAEGVETADQLTYLAERDCDGVQGFLIGKALGASTFSKDWATLYPH
jgi:diguanylate cyclase (GGDEF)-like protein